MDSTDRFDDRNGADFHRADLETERQDNLVLLALGEAVPTDFERHHGGCAHCQADLDAYAYTVALGRDASAYREYLDSTPAETVWTAITAELSPSELRRPNPARPSWRREPGPAAARQPGLRPRHGPRQRPGSLVRSRYALVAAALVLGLGGTVGGYLAGHSAGSAQTHVASNAHLAGVPGGPGRVSGSATVHSSSAGRQVTVTTTGLALRNGFYEVWLYDPDRGRGGDMVAVGALGDHGRGTFTLPSGIDIRAYHVVNVSAQDYGGGASIVHARSVLQGSLTQ